jgi:hypothetical protein
MSPDYGIDKEVEIFENEKSTGLIFKVQIKGTKAPKYILNGSALSFSMSIQDIDYLCNELRIPVILVVVDVVKKIVWWHPIQLDSDLAGSLVQAKSEGQNSVTIRICSDRTLPNTWRLLFDKARESAAVLHVRSLSSTSPDTFLNSARSLNDIDAAIAGLGRNTALLRSAKLNHLWRQGDYISVKKLVDMVIDSGASSVEEKFEAYTYLNKLALFEARAQGASHNYGKINYSFAKKLIAITRRGPLHLRTFGILSLLAAELDIYAHNDLYLYMNYVINKAPENKGFTEPLWAMMLPNERIRAAYSVVHKYKQCHRLLGFMFKKGVFSVIPSGIDLVISGMIAFLLRLRRERMADAANLYERSLREMAEMAISISLKLRDWDEASYITLNGTLLCDIGNEQSSALYLTWGTGLLQKIEDPALRTSGLESLKAQFKKFEEFPAESNIDHEDETDQNSVEEKQIYAGMAKSLGIDLDDPDDMLSEIVNIGIRDLDPTRVLMQCRYLYLAIGSSGLPARMLMLPSAGSKTLYCTLHGHGLASLSLDYILNLFAANIVQSVRIKSHILQAGNGRIPGSANSTSSTEGNFGHYRKLNIFLRLKMFENPFDALLTFDGQKSLLRYRLC